MKSGASNQERGEEPLHAMDPTGRFSNRASDYVRFRPSYPSAAVDAMLEGLGRPLTAADIGAGTGISSRLLAERGVRVIAVEPNAAMRAEAEGHPLVEWRDGTGEATGLPQGSVALVVCAQAFHWMKQDLSLVEFARVLVPRGRIAILWNERDRRDPMTTAYREAILAVGGEHPAEMRPFDPGVIAWSGRYEPVRLVEAPNAQRLDESGLIGRAMSASYVPKEGPRRDALVQSLRAVFARFKGNDGAVTMRYITRVWIAEKRG